MTTSSPPPGPGWPTDVPPPSPPPPAPPPAAGPPPLTASRRRLTRTPDGKVGGVCAGLGHYLDIDPVFVRMAFIAFTLLAGTGLLIYLAAWLLVPKGGPADMVPASGPLAAPNRSTVIGVVGLAIGAALLIDGNPFGGRLDGVASILLIAAGVALLVQRDHPPEPAPAGWPSPAGPRPAGGPGGSGLTADPGGPAPVLGAPSPGTWPPDDAFEPGGGPAPGSWPPGASVPPAQAFVSPAASPPAPGPAADMAGPATDLPEPPAASAGPWASSAAPVGEGSTANPASAPAPAWAPAGPPPPGPPPGPLGGSTGGPPRRLGPAAAVVSRRPVTAIGLSLLAIALGAAIAADLAGWLELSWSAAFAGGLVVVGVVLVVAAFVDRAPGLVAVGVVLTGGLLVASAAEPWVDHGIGSRVERPRSLAELAESYRLGFGELELDLRSVDVPPGASRTVEVRVGVGRAEVLLPDDVTVELRGRVGMGELTGPDGDIVNGADRELDDTIEAPGGGHLRIDMKVGIGEGSVERG